MAQEVWPGLNISWDWMDSAGLMMEMEQDTGHQYLITLSSAGSAKSPDLLVECIAVKKVGPDAEHAPLESLKFLASTKRLNSLKAVIFYALYAMNFQLDKPEGDDTPF